MIIKVINPPRKCKSNFNLRDLIELRRIEGVDAFVDCANKLHLITQLRVVRVCDGIVHQYRDATFTVKYFCDLEIKVIPKC